MRADARRGSVCAAAPREARALPAPRSTGMDEAEATIRPPSEVRADARIRTADPFITSEVLYQLSYVGPARNSLALGRGAAQ